MSLGSTAAQEGLHMKSGRTVVHMVISLVICFAILCAFIASVNALHRRYKRSEERRALQHVSDARNYRHHPNLERGPRLLDRGPQNLNS